MSVGWISTVNGALRFTEASYAGTDEQTDGQNEVSILLTLTGRSRLIGYQLIGGVIIRNSQFTLIYRIRV
ncbi:MAG: hypothetical protein F6K16_30610 [Symploca sp. SIO2B6]|nr:hypothetical protein [Symploca sp. SIO2B6]